STSIGSTSGRNTAPDRRTAGSWAPGAAAGGDAAATAGVAGADAAGGAGSGTAGTPAAGVAVRRRSSRCEPRRPSARAMRPSAAARDGLTQGLVQEHPRAEAYGLARVVGAERGPVDDAARIRRAEATPLSLDQHLADARDPHPELRRPQDHPAARCLIA